MVTKDNIRILGLSLCMVFLFLEIGFEIRLPGSGGDHIFDVYLYEIAGLILGIITIAKILRRKRIGKLPFLFLCIYIGIMLGYVSLFMARIRFGGNYADSIWLFRNLFCGLTLSLSMITASRDIAPEQYNRFFIVTFFLLSAGYLFHVLKSRQFNTNFPNYAITYYSLGLMAFPYLTYLLIQRNEHGIYRILTEFNIWSILTVCVLSGSRSVFCIALLITGITLLTALKNIKRLGVIFLAAAGILVFYAGDVYMCRSAVHRSLGIQITGEELKEPEKVIEKAMEERAQIANEGGVQDMEYHNPVSHSNAVRVVLLRDALQELSGDWLFHMKGKTVFQFHQGGESILSGTHNFIMDYILAFGLFITTPVLLYAGSLVVVTLRKMHWLSGKEPLYYLLSILSVLMIGMVQAIMSDRIVIGVVLLHLSYILRSKMEEDHYETGFTEKRNYLYGGGF